MCSLNDAEDADIGNNDELMDQKSNLMNLGPGVSCRVCSQAPAELVLRVRDAYCRECFLLSTVHKFRAVLGKSRLMKPKESVLIGFSGSQSSIALLNLTHQGLHVASHKRLMFCPSLIYIDEGAILGLSSDERLSNCASIAKIALKYEFPTYMTTLDKSLDDVTTIGRSLSVLEPNTLYDFKEEDDVRLRAVVDSARSLTSKEDLVRILRNNLLLAIAKHLRCTKIFVADVENDLAITLLSNISLGRGAQLPLDVGFCDSRDPDVTILRPMRDFMRKEVTFYNVFLKLESVFIPSLGTKSPSDASIQRLTAGFISDLQANFPATVSTVFRTGEKLSLADSGPEETCALCRAPLDMTSLASSARFATDFSHMVSTLGPAGFDSHSVGNAPTPDSRPTPKDEVRPCSAPSDGACGCHASSSCSDPGVTWLQAEEFLCYGCRLISKELETNSQQLPPALLQRVREHSNYKRMRKEIQDFLL